MPATASTDVNDDDDDDVAVPENPGQYGEENLLQVTIVEEPLDVVQILGTSVTLPG